MPPGMEKTVIRSYHEITFGKVIGIKRRYGRNTAHLADSNTALCHYLSAKSQQREYNNNEYLSHTSSFFN
jgi:hypothetical protein